MILKDKEVGYKTYCQIQELQIQEEKKVSRARKEKDIEAKYDAQNRVSAFVIVKSILIKNFGLTFEQ